MKQTLRRFIHIALARQLLEDFRSDSRHTIRGMAAVRRPSPVLRRLGIALDDMRSRLEAASNDAGGGCSR